MTRTVPICRSPARATLLVFNHPVPSRPGVALEDWDLLFTAVSARLRDAVVAQEQGGDPAQLRACVLDCLDALEQLRVTHNHAWAAQQRLARVHTDPA